MSKEKNYKIYVIGSSTGYARWIEGILTNDMSKADVVVLTGGEDISPAIYNEPIAKPSHCYVDKGSTVSKRDAFELEEFNRAKLLGKPIWGTCRGLIM